MRYIDLFAGIGGFRYGFELADPRFKCVYTSEWLEKPRSIYRYHWGGEIDGRDVRLIRGSELPEADLIVGGFPCATFSIAGKRTGFCLSDTRGTLCFEIFRIALEGGIPYILLENVKGLLNHEDGKTFGVILSALDEMGYDAQWEMLDSQSFGIPQHRERVFIIGHLRGKPRPKVFPIGQTGEADAGEGADGKRPHINHSQLTQWRRGYFRDYKSEGVPTLTANMGTGGHNVPFIVKATLTPNREDKRQRGRRFKGHNEPAFTLGVQDKHGVLIDDGVKTEIRKLTPIECERLQGLSDNFTKHMIMDDGSKKINSDSDRYERCGRTVTSTVIKAIGEKLIRSFYGEI